MPHGGSVLVLSSTPSISGEANHRMVLDVSTLETWLWDAACQIRGPVDAPKFKDYILPLVFLKRLSDVFDDECAHVAAELGDADLVEDDHKLVRFYLPPEARWPAIASKTTGLGEHLTNAVRATTRENPALLGVLDVVDFNATASGQRIVDDTRLAQLVQVLGQHRLGLADVEPDILGRAYEYLLRKFAEGQGQTAGEFYTPREVGILIARLLEPAPGQTLYDPCCGSSGLLIKGHLRVLETHGEQVNGRRALPAHLAPLRCFGQEDNYATVALSRMNAFLHDLDADIRRGDTMRHPAFLADDGRLRRFDLVAANPMWNQDFPISTYEHDPYDRFAFGVPPASSADWGWVQHMNASLADGGRMAVVLDTGAPSRGSGNRGANRERDIRKAFVSGALLTPGDLVEAVILLKENLFYNTTAPGVILVLNKAKRHPGEILLINASSLFEKGRPKNYLTDAHVERLARLYHDWAAEEGLSAIITNEEAARNDYNLSPSRYVAQNSADDVLPLEEAVVLLREAEEERAAADRDLETVLAALGLGGLRHA
jgi:type I restriction enzyme M protein